MTVGDANACTTEVLTAFANGQWPKYYLPTSFEPFNTECQYVVQIDDQTSPHFMTNNNRIANKKIELQLWDMAGQEDYPALRKLSYHGANVFVLCFSADIPTENSFQDFTRKWILEMAKECPNVPIILVGTRNPHGERDDEGEGGGQAASRGIQVRKLRAGNLGTFKYIYCDPKSGEGVDYAFHCVRTLDGDLTGPSC